MLLLAPVARGAGRDPVRDELQRGVKLYEAGHLDEAMRALQVAYDHRPLPRLLSLMCQIEVARRRPAEAIALCRRYLRDEQDIDAAERARVLGLIAEQRARLPLPPRAPRPKWRLATGAVALALGVGIGTYGVGALVIDHGCVGQDAVLCPMVHNTLAPGLGFTISGGLLSLAGLTLLALPGARPPVAEPQDRLTVAQGVLR